MSKNKNQDIDWEFLYNYYKIDIGKLILHPFFRIFWNKAGYKFIVGSKNGGKSKTAALRIATKFLSNPNRHCVVTRKYKEDHIRSTLPDIVWAFNLIAEVCKIPKLKPVEADKFRKGEKGVLKYTRSSPLYIENTISKQRIHFLGLEQLAAGGFTPGINPNHTCDTIWAEELVDLERGERQEEFDDTSFSAWRVAEDTVIRGTWIDGKRQTKENNKQGRDFSWVQEEIIFTSNSHRHEHWIIREFIDKFVPLDPSNVEDCERMEREKVRIYYDPSYMNGRGLLVTRLSVFLNPFRDDYKIKQLKKDDFKEYAYLALGATKSIGGLAYSGYAHNLINRKIMDSEYELLWPISIGIDHAISADHKDWFAALFHATTTEILVFDNGRFIVPSYEKKIYYDEYAYHPKTMGAVDDSYYARQVITKLRNWVNTIPNWREKILEKGFIISVDYSAGSFMHTLQKEIKDFSLAYPEDIWLNNIRVVACQGKNKQILIDGLKLNAREGRVARNKRFLNEKMLWIDRFRCPRAYRGFLNTALSQKDGKVIDKERDFVDGMDYAEMIDEVVNNYDKKMFESENRRKELIATNEKKIGQF